ncbi:CO dehydrogenase/acetyl-CoA synthase complex subunit epsilon [Archaeoglobus veneficus]|uniref:CO dehydrogenase/acetyl-CoA synthase complex, epsilon subunit n=1 Tax=Archaeoglobus veneficus (strain DSM 11195 / SNP6) TaxID=693661 RepID=F2KTA2_ARCVS|nr:CO dehydrogenase/acetyl-CoA synthase complex subunit epsilon [Archaeoglobus veneficus]AEA47132.1 CO dehydrogenase/acetyl-CoA synthase complex, epsilon subunit [Archaeoglobus veneficus SNP6]
MAEAKKKVRKPPEKLFNTADIQASRSAKLIKPDVLAKMVGRAKNPVLVTGGKLLEDEKLVEYAVKLYENGVAIIATGASSRPLIERGVEPQACVFTLHHVTQFLLDESWSGFKGEPYDLVLFLGFEPYYLSRMLSALKHFSKLTTVSIDAFYQPHARFSFPNTLDLHHEILEEFVTALGGGSVGKKED